MTLKTRKLTGRPPWPITLLAGTEKVGKTWAAVEASISDLVGHTLWFSIGEDIPDEYRKLPGFVDDRFDVVEYDGTYRGLRDALVDANGFRDVDGKPTLWVLDSASRLWDMLSGMAQIEANHRYARKHNGQAPNEDVRPTVDLWNLATDRWGYVLDEVRAHQGPSILTARMELTTVMNSNGDPTKEKVQKIQAQKRLPFDVGAIVEMPALGETYLSGVRSVKLAQMQPRVVFKDFKMDTLWRRLGLADEPVGHRDYSAIDPDDKPALAAERAREELRALAAENGWDPVDIVAAYADQAGGMALKDATSAPAIRAFMKAYADEQKKVTV